MSKRTSANSRAPASEGQRPRVRLALVGAIVLLIFAAYASALRSPFLFDDVPAVVDNPTIAHLGSLDVLTPPDNGSAVTGRPVVNLTFAIDHAIGDDHPAVYHLTNIVIHLAAALLLFGLMERTLRLPALRSAVGDRALSVAGSVALLWALHPLLTETVVCVAQRTESLCGLLILATLYGFIRGVTKDRDGSASSNTRWLAISAATCLAGMATKEVMVVAPLIVLLFDRTFIAGSFAAAWKQRRGYYLTLAGTWALLAWLVLRNSGARGVAAGFGLGVSPWHYLLTQCEALTLYLRLAFWPYPLVVDYGNMLVTSVASVWWQGLAVIGLLAATVWALVRRPALGFAGACFFLILAPSSSVIPLVTQTMAEHRMYLPLIPILAITVLAFHRVLGRRSDALFAVAGLCLAAATVARTRDYRDTFTLWRDTVEKRPESARAQNNLAVVLHERNQDDPADHHFAAAVALRPDYANAYYNWGVALLDRGRIADAISRLEKAVALIPDYADAHMNLGNALARAGRTIEALAHFQTALSIAPAADVHYNMGVVLLDLGQIREARSHLQASLQMEADQPEAIYRLGRIAEQSGQTAEAERFYLSALRLAPDHVDAHRRVGLLLARAGRIDDAATHFQAIVRLDPADVDARANLANTCLARGHIREAIQLYEEVLRLRPDDRQTRENLRLAREALGQ